MRLRATGFLLVPAAILIIAELWLGLDGMPPAVLATLSVAVIAAGVPHGALDLWISRSEGMWSGWRSFFGFHAAYIACAGAAFAAFMAYPALALLVFLVLSIVHFAGDWDRQLPHGLRLVLGFLTLALPFAAHPNDVAAIFGVLLGGFDAETDTSVAGLQQHLPQVMLASIGAVAIADWRQLPLAVAVFASAVLLPPLVFFGLYFAFWHSPEHLRRHGALLQSRSQRRVLFIYSVLAAGLAAGLVGVTFPRDAGLGMPDHLVRVTFWGLAAFTVPHMILLGMAAHGRVTK